MPPTIAIPPPALPLPVQAALRKLGSDIRDARRRRRIPAEVMAQRALVTRSTFHKVERGDPTVSLGTFASTLFALGMINRLADVADARFDAVGLGLDEERLPKRIHTKPIRPKQDAP